MSEEEERDVKFMEMALREAEKAAADGEVPLGCVIAAPEVLEPAHDGHDAVCDWDPLRARILGRAHNQTEGLSPLTDAELKARGEYAARSRLGA